MINSRSLDDLRPDVRANAEAWLRECRAQGLDVLVTQTLRDDEYQAKLYAQGRTKPGSIVTNSKVTTFHGKGLALDFCANRPGWEYAALQFFFIHSFSSLLQMVRPVYRSGILYRYNSVHPADLL